MGKPRKPTPPPTPSPPPPPPPRTPQSPPCTPPSPLDMDTVLRTLLSVDTQMVNPYRCSYFSLIHADKYEYISIQTRPSETPESCMYPGIPSCNMALFSFLWISFLRNLKVKLDWLPVTWWTPLLQWRQNSTSTSLFLHLGTYQKSFATIMIHKDNNHDHNFVSLLSFNNDSWFPDCQWSKSCSVFFLPAPTPTRPPPPAQACAKDTGFKSKQQQTIKTPITPFWTNRKIKTEFNDAFQLRPSLSLPEPHHWLHKPFIEVIIIVVL